MLIDEYNRIKNRLVERVSEIETELKPLVTQRDELTHRIDTLRHELWGINAALGYHTNHEKVELPEWGNLPELDGSVPSKMGEAASTEPVVETATPATEPVTTASTEVATPATTTSEPPVAPVVPETAPSAVQWAGKTMTQRAMEFMGANRSFTAAELVKVLVSPAGHHPSVATFVNLFLKKKVQAGHITYDGVTYTVKPVSQAIPTPLANGAQWKCDCSYSPWNRATALYCAFCKRQASTATEFRTTTPEGFAPVGPVTAPQPTAAPAPSASNTTVTVRAPRKLGAVSLHGDYPPGVATHTRELIDYMRDRAHHSHTLDEIVRWYTNKGITSPANTLRHNANQALMDLVRRGCLVRTGKAKYKVTNYLNYTVPTDLTDIDWASMTIDELIAYQTP